MRLFLLLIAGVIGSECIDSPQISDLAVSCATKSGLMKRLVFAARNDLVSVATCEKPIESKSVTIRGSSISNVNLCDFSSLASFEQISCESVGGIISSVA